MKKFLVLIIGLSLTAASCDITSGLFSFGSGTRGIFKSDDGGVTFNISNTVSPKGDLNNLSVTSMAIDPTNRDVVYVSAGAGLYKSEDAGEKWKYILSGIAISDMAIDPFSASTIYVAGIAGQNGKIIKTVDGGTSWVDIYTEPSQNDTVLSIAISPSSPSTILAGLYNGELLRSTDGGRTWSAVKDFGQRVLEIKFGSGGNTAYALTSRAGLYKSTDSGVTWTESTTALTYDILSSPNRALTSVSAFHDLALDSRTSGVIYLGTEEGMFRSVDDGVNWSFMSLPLRNTALKVSAIAIDPNNANIIFATVASTIYKSINGGVTWETKVLPTKAAVDTILINPNSSNIIYLGLKGQ
jgi:photosystem II stability/assembly factor-like uncharacterized protein